MAAVRQALTTLEEIESGLQSFLQAIGRHLTESLIAARPSERLVCGRRWHSALGFRASADRAQRGAVNAPDECLDRVQSALPRRTLGGILAIAHSLGGRGCSPSMQRRCRGQRLGRSRPLGRVFVGHLGPARARGGEVGTRDTPHRYDGLCVIRGLSQPRNGADGPGDFDLGSPQRSSPGPPSHHGGIDR